MAHLERLSLAANRLSTVPPEIGALTSLRVLDLSANELVSLPHELGRLPLRDLYLGENPLSDILEKAVEQGLEALLAYLRSLEGATRPCREGKLLLVGEGNVGKSSILAALRNEPFIADRATTHGIEISEVTVEAPAGDMVLNAWDFGGQEIYRVTHQFFFSQESIFLVVWRPREGFDQGEVQEWLNRIRRRIGNAGSVLLVSTHAEEGRLHHVDIEDIEHRYYPLVKGYVAVDSETGSGFTELRALIAACGDELRHVDDPMSEHWLELWHSLRSEDIPLMPRSKYLTLALAAGLDPSEADAWLALFHAMGKILFYRGDVGLGAVIVLDPELLARSVSFVLEDSEVIDNNGVVSHRHLAEIWAEHLHFRGVSLDEVFPYLVRLMERSEISFRSDDGESSLIAPVVGFRRPLDLPWEPSDEIRGNAVVQLSLILGFEAEPLGLLSWLTVRTVRWTTGRHWRRGVFLRNDAQQAEALIELIDSSSVVLTVRAPYPLEMFSVLKNEIESIVGQRWPFLHYDSQVPCLSSRRGNNSCNGRFPLNSLVQALQLKVPELRCLACLREHDVGLLLIGFPMEQPQGPSSMQRVSERMTDIASGVMSLETRVRDIGQRGDATASALAEAVGLIRDVRSTVGLVARDCPRLFSIAPEGLSTFDARRVWEQKFQLHLWCEHPGGEHLVEPSYMFTRPKEWFRRSAPVIRMMAKMLRILPVLSGVGALAIDGMDSEMALEELAIMSAIGEASWDLYAEGGDDEAVGILPVGNGSGYEWRVLKELLLEVDPPPQRFAGLSPAAALGGDVVWVCPTHLRQYDPGLPSGGPYRAE